MAPKKAQKMALTDFLQDSSLGSWADEMDSLPSAPAARSEEDRNRGRDFGARDRFDDYPNRESRYPPREELPLPTAPPYTAFVGNLAFDIREDDVEEFFQTKLKSVKIIKDRDDKPKGFGYVEFDSLQDLKDGLAKTGSQLAGRAVRVSVAEPPKDRPGRDAGFDDSGPWRRDGPPPSHDRGGFRGGSRYDDGGRGGSSREPLPPTEAEETSDWRANARAPPVRGSPGLDRPAPGPRKPSGFTPQESNHAADTEDVWQRGSKFTAAEPEKPSFRTGKSDFFRRDSRPTEDEPTDWRTAPRKPSATQSHGWASNERSPTGSVPSTPNMGRRKLELLPRTTSQATSPVGSPKASTPTAILQRANPFGDARPVDAAAREKEVEERLARDREARVNATAKSNETSPRVRPSDRPATRTPAAEGGSWRRGPPAAAQSGSSRPISAAHSRAASTEAASPATATSTKKQSAHFSFAAIATEDIPVDEGEEETENDHEVKAITENLNLTGLSV